MYLFLFISSGDSMTITIMTDAIYLLFIYAHPIIKFFSFQLIAFLCIYVYYSFMKFYFLFVLRQDVN